MLTKQGVTLTGCNTTGPPSCAVPWWVALHMRRREVLQTTTDASKQNNTGPLHYFLFPFIQHHICQTLPRIHGTF